MKFFPQCEESFNPYIHGTNSSILPMLKRTAFQMLSPLQLLEHYGLAPMSGEICGYLGGGLDNLFEDCSSQRLCFGRMNASARYNLDGVIGSYTKFDVPSEEGLKGVIREESNCALNSAFTRINIMLVYFARLKQLGTELDVNQFEKIKTDFNGLIQFYYLLMMLGKYIHPDFSAYEEAKRRAEDLIIETQELHEEYERKKPNFASFFPNYSFENFMRSKKSVAAGSYLSAFVAHFTLEKLVAKIVEAKLDIKSIFENPTEENLRKVLPILALPKTSNFSALTGIEGGNEEVTLEKTQFFSLDQKYQEGSNVDIDSVLLSDLNRGKDFNRLFSSIFNRRITSSGFETFREMLVNRVTLLQEKFTLLQKILERPIDEVRFDAEELEIIQKPFPIILICSAEEKIDLCDSYTEEYRARETLKFGEDITMIATDTEDHQLFVKEYLEKNGICKVSVVLIDQLRESQKTGEKSAVLSTHYDN